MEVCIRTFGGICRVNVCLPAIMGGVTVAFTVGFGILSFMIDRIRLKFENFVAGDQVILRVTLKLLLISPYCCLLLQTIRRHQTITHYTSMFPMLMPCNLEGMHVRSTVVHATT